MGSLSQFILEESIKEHLDDEFSQANQENGWEQYYDKCCSYLTAAQTERPTICFSSAISLVQFYYNKSLESPQEQAVTDRCCHMLELLLGLCHDRCSRECPDWHQQLIKSLLSMCFIPALKHSDQEVVHFGVKQILHLIESPVCSDLIDHPGLVPSIVGAIGDLSLRQTKVAKTALVKLCETEAGLHAVFSTRDSLDAMTKAADSNNSIKFNIFEVVQKVCVLGDCQLSVVSNSGWLDQLVNAASGDDTLAHMAALHQLTELLAEQRTMKLFIDCGVLHKLYEHLRTAHQDPDSLAAMTIPDLLKLFGNVGRRDPDLIFKEFGESISIMLQSCANTGPHFDTLPLIAFESLTLVTSTYTGKKILHCSHRSELLECLHNVGDQIRQGKMVQRVRYFAAAMRLLDIDTLPTDHIELDELSELMQYWYCELFQGNSIAPIDRLMRLPFPEMHILAYEMMIMITKYEWAVRLIATHHGILKYLLDRSTGHQKTDKEAKFGVVSALVEYKDILLELSGERLTEQLCAYKKQGALYVPPYTETGPVQVAQ